MSSSGSESASAGGPGGAGGAGGLVGVGGVGGGLVGVGGAGGGFGGAGGAGGASSAGGGATATGSGGAGGAASSSSSSSASSSSGIVACASNETCVLQPLPSGWHGPFRVYQGPSSATLPACDGGATPAFQGGVDLVAPPVTCAPSCSCGAPTGITCNTSATVSSSNTCDPTQACATGPLTSTCAPLGAASTCATTMGGLFVSVTSNPTGGMCAPTITAPMATKIPAAYATNVVGCPIGATPAPCTGGVCEPSPVSGVVQLCIMTSGDAATCPDVQFPNRMSVGIGINDDRGCTTCSCSPPQQATCLGAAATFSSTANGCGGTPGTSKCSALTNIQTGSTVYGQLTMPATPSGGACMAGGGTAAGTAAPMSNITLCCM